MRFDLPYTVVNWKKIHHIKHGRSKMKPTKISKKEKKIKGLNFFQLHVEWEGVIMEEVKEIMLHEM